MISSLQLPIRWNGIDLEQTMSHCSIIKKDIGATPFRVVVLSGQSAWPS